MSNIYAERQRSVLIAGCQMQDVQGDPAAALRMVKEVTAQAVADGAEIVCFPEGFLTGYTRDEATARQRAISLSSPSFRATCRQLSALEATVVVGLIERDGKDVFSSAVVITPGRPARVYRKRHPIEDCFTPGRSLPTFTVGPVRIGIGICSDARAADDATALVKQGVNVLLYPLNNMLPRVTADRWRHQHPQILRQRAQQAEVWVVSADVIGSTTDHISYGCSTAIDPTGKIVDQVDHQTPGITLARIPLP